MKLLIVNTIPFDLNGMSSVIFNYFKYMDKTDIEYHFLVNNYIDKNLKKEIESMGGIIHVMRGRNKKPWQYVYELRKLAKKERFDIVHVHGNSATMEFELLAFKGLTAKKIVHVHGVNTQHPVVHRLLMPFFSKSYDVAYAASSQAGAWLIKDGKYQVINNGIDAKRFEFDNDARKRMRKSLKIADNQSVILHVGAFSEQKNHKFLIRVFNEVYKHNSNCLLVLIGKGTEVDQIKNYCNANGLSKVVRFLGEQIDTPKYYSAADLFLFPSKFEPFGIVTLEAQSSGLQVVASDVLPRSVDVTSQVTFLNLSEGYEKWGQTILAQLEVMKRKKRTNKQFYNDFVEKDYAIVENASLMRKRYFKLIR